MERIANRTNSNENIDNTQLLPPPPYTAVIYKLNENEFERNPPAYSDVDAQSITYINNYPGPPLTDGYVPTSEILRTINQNSLISKKLFIYLIIDGIITIILGIAAVSLQIAILASKSIIYYYYGFWGGAIVISLGISTLVLYRHRCNLDSTKLFHSFSCQLFLISVIFIIALIIILTDKCDDNGTENDGTNQVCQKSNKILNGFLFAMFVVAFFQAIINTIAFAIIKRQDSINRNSSSS